MTLGEYLSAKGLTYSAFGKKIGVSHEAVRRYANEGRVPAAAVMREIMRETEGVVGPADFFPAAEPAEQLARAS